LRTWAELKIAARTRHQTRPRFIHMHDRLQVCKTQKRKVHGIAT
jgi:hypothetical protein